MKQEPRKLRSNIMKILFIGDIVGKSGRLAVKEQLPYLKEKYNPDFVIANSENAAHGKGITPKLFHELLSYGVDCITMGNHTYSKNNIKDIVNEKKLVTPENYVMYDAQGSRTFEVLGEKLTVVNLLGQVFMDREVFNPYQTLESVIMKHPDSLVFVDFHAEATGEKQTLMRYFKDKTVAVVGTHTHVQTADEQIVENCAYISDVGMCGCVESILGRNIDEVIASSVKKVKTTYTIAEGPYQLNAVLIRISNKKAVSIERINIRQNG